MDTAIEVKIFGAEIGQRGMMETTYSALLIALKGMDGGVPVDMQLRVEIAYVKQGGILDVMLSEARTITEPLRITKNFKAFKPRPLDETTPKISRTTIDAVKASICERAQRMNESAGRDRKVRTIIFKVGDREEEEERIGEILPYRSSSTDERNANPSVRYVAATSP